MGSPSRANDPSPPEGLQARILASDGDFALASLVIPGVTDKLRAQLLVLRFGNHASWSLHLVYPAPGGGGHKSTAGSGAAEYAFTTQVDPPAVVRHDCRQALLLLLTGVGFQQKVLEPFIEHLRRVGAL